MSTRLGVVALFVLSPSIALAEPGEWIEGSFGLRRTFGTLSYTDEAHGGPPRTITLEDRLDGTGLALLGRVGYAGSKHWAVGLGLGVVVTGFDRNGFTGATIDFALATPVSVEARFRPFGNGFFLGPSLGYTRVSLAGSKDDFGSPDNIFESETLTGPELLLVAGWVDGLLGVQVDVGYQHLSAEHTKYRPFSIGLSLVIQHWSGE
jgi:hypothetical protein